MSLVGVKLVVQKVLNASYLNTSNTTDNNNNNNNNNNITKNDSPSESTALLPPDIENNIQSSQLQNQNQSQNQLQDQNISNSTSIDEISSKSSNNDSINLNSPFPLNILKTVDPRIMSDLIIGLSDGLTVPFALTAGLSSLGDTSLVITGGMAELVSGAISMGLGGYLAAKSENEYYFSQVRKEKQIFFQNQDNITDDLYEILIDMGASDLTAENFINDLSKDPQQMIDFIIKFGRGLEEPPEGRIVSSALTIGSGYFFGGFIPLIPYFFLKTVNQALLSSVLLMLFTLFWFGYFKSLISMGEDCSKTTRCLEGLQMILIGSIAAGSAWSLVYFIDN